MVVLVVCDVKMQTARLAKPHTMPCLHRARRAPFQVKYCAEAWCSGSSFSSCPAVFLCVKLLTAVHADYLPSRAVQGWARKLQPWMSGRQQLRTSKPHCYIKTPWLGCPPRVPRVPLNPTLHFCARAFCIANSSSAFSSLCPKGPRRELRKNINRTERKGQIIIILTIPRQA